MILHLQQVWTGQDTMDLTVYLGQGKWETALFAIPMTVSDLNTLLLLATGSHSLRVVTSTCRICRCGAFFLCYRSYRNLSMKSPLKYCGHGVLSRSKHPILALVIFSFRCSFQVAWRRSFESLPAVSLAHYMRTRGSQYLLACQLKSVFTSTQ